jgi:FkbM family methyltransferase
MKGLSKLIYRYHQFKRHPLARLRIWRVMFRYLLFNMASGNREKIYDFIGGLKFYATRGDAGIVANIYTGLYDFEEMSFMLHYLRDQNIFVDVGANVGEYALLASGIANAHSFAYEPVPTTFDKLKKNVAVNGLQNKIEARNKGVSSKKSTLFFTQNKGVMNHVLKGKKQGAIEVEVESLNEAFKMTSADLLKIDVEGHEMEVLDGADQLLSSDRLQAIIIEINDRTTVAGYSPNAVHDRLSKHGFFPVQYLPLSRKLIQLQTYKKDQFNTIYIKNIENASTLLKSGKKISVFGLSY